MGKEQWSTGARFSPGLNLPGPGMEPEFIGLKFAGAGDLKNLILAFL